MGGLHVCLLLLYLQMLAPGVAAAPAEIEVNVGSDAKLPCRVSKPGELRVLEWKKEGQSDYVFYFRDNREYPTYQNPPYQGRVKLLDQQMTDGEMSIVLSPTMLNDTGTYTCKVAMDTETTQTIDLTVKVSTEPFPVWAIVVLVLPVPVLIAVASLIYRVKFYPKSGSVQNQPGDTRTGSADPKPLIGNQSK